MKEQGAGRNLISVNLRLHLIAHFFSERRFIMIVYDQFLYTIDEMVDKTFQS